MLSASLRVRLPLIFLRVACSRVSVTAAISVQLFNQFAQRPDAFAVDA